MVLGDSLEVQFLFEQIERVLNLEANTKIEPILDFNIWVDFYALIMRETQLNIRI